MINFHIFNWQNKSHKELAEKFQDILYIDYSGHEERIRVGHLLVTEHEHGYDEYKVVRRDNSSFDACGVMFAPIKIRDEWEEV